MKKILYGNDAKEAILRGVENELHAFGARVILPQQFKDNLVQSSS